MANNLIPEELNALIQQYLTDGVLTGKERQVILNKAEKMGLDRDEIDLLLDAEIQKIEQAADASARQRKGKTCPYCGGAVPQLAEKCPHCDENITAQASEELQEIFDNLEEALVEMKSGRDLRRSKATVERYIRKAKMYYGNNPKVQKILEEVESESVKVEKKVKSKTLKDNILKSRAFSGLLSIAFSLFVLFIIIPYMWRCTNNESEINESSNNLSTLITNYLEDGDLAAAKESLIDFVVPKGCYPSTFVEKFDGTYQKVIRAYVKEGDYDAIEELAIAYRSKICDERSWAESPIYIYLKSIYKKEGLDFTILEPMEDEKNNQDSDELLKDAEDQIEKALKDAEDQIEKAAEQINSDELLKDAEEQIKRAAEEINEVSGDVEY